MTDSSAANGTGGKAMFNTCGKSATQLICVAITLVCTGATHADDANPLATIMRSDSNAQLPAKQDSVASAAKLSWAELTSNKSSTGSSAKQMTLLSSPTNNLVAGVCGDGSPDPGETCDDSNTVGGDGCDATCLIEAGSDCTAAIAGIDAENILVNGSFETGIAPWTNTGTPNPPISSPDSCGGCDLSFEQQGGGWYWAGGAPSESSTSATQMLIIPASAAALTFNVWEGLCVPDNGTGDFVSVTIDGNEVYNSGVCTTESQYAQALTVDLATAPGGPYNDGGSHTIAVLGTMGFTAGDPQTGSIFVDHLTVNVPLAQPIDPVPSSCLVGVCGDGILSVGEACDDNNTTGGDGCDAVCAVEEDTWVCVNDLADTALDVLTGSLSSNDDIVDGSLEQGSPNPDWAETGTVFTPICSEAFCGAALAQDGDFFAWFGGASEPNSQSLTQSDVAISSAATDLTFDFLVGVCDSASDVFRLTIDGNTEFEYFCTADTSGYETQTVDLTAGGYNNDGLHEIVVSADTFSINTGNSNFFVDNVSIAYAVSPDRAPNPGECFALDGICPAPGSGPGPGFGIEKFETGLGIMSSFELGTLSAPNNWTTTDDEWTFVGDASGCGTSDFSVANWSGGNLTGGSGEAACADSDGGAESLASPDPAVACIDAVDSTLTCQTKAYLCTPAIDTSSMTDPGVTATVHYQTATQDFDTPDFDDDEIFQVLVGDLPPNPFTIANYRSAGVVLDHNSGTLASSGSLTIGVNLDDFRDPAVQGCVDPTEGPPCSISGVQVPLDASNLRVCVLYAGIYSWYGQVDNVASRADNCTVGDADFDLVPDDVDNCPDDYNPNQDPAACADSDNDGIPDATDNCPAVANPGQENNDGDSAGDACDDDDDNDTVNDNVDNCPLDENTDQADNDNDNIGDVCDPDDDNDTVDDNVDNCPIDANTDQADNDNDGAGDACDDDDDNDTVNDNVDNCPLDENTDQADNDNDNIGDVCDPDDDNDAIDDNVDNCPIDANTDQADNDNDGAGDACDDDVDGDNVLNNDDVCPATTIPEGVPTNHLKKNRYALTGMPSNSIFQSTNKTPFTTADTGGCSCEQIINALGLGRGHVNFGCSKSAMQEWSNLVN